MLIRGSSTRRCRAPVAGGYQSSWQLFKSLLVCFLIFAVARIFFSVFVLFLASQLCPGCPGGFLSIRLWPVHISPFLLETKDTIFYPRFSSHNFWTCFLVVFFFISRQGPTAWLVVFVAEPRSGCSKRMLRGVSVGRERSGGAGPEGDPGWRAHRCSLRSPDPWSLLFVLSCLFCSLLSEHKNKLLFLFGELFCELFVLAFRSVLLISL